MKKLLNWFISLFKEEKQPEVVSTPDPIVEVIKAKAEPAKKKAAPKKAAAPKAETTKKKPSGTAAPKKPAVKKTKGK